MIPPKGLSSKITTFLKAGGAVRDKTGCKQHPEGHKRECSVARSTSDKTRVKTKFPPPLVPPSLPLHPLIPPLYPPELALLVHGYLLSVFLKKSI